jgi:hypothetical protein
MLELATAALGLLLLGGAARRLGRRRPG